LLTTVSDLRQRIKADMTGLVRELQDRTGRYGDDEAHAWRRSLPKFGDAFRAEAFQPIHLYFGGRGNVALEYQLPAASSWCDVVMLGGHDGRKAAVIVELKDWVVRSDRPGRAEGLVERQGRQELHPSDQVRGYAQYCRRFHSAIAAHNASVHGCVLFTNERWFANYSAPPNDRLAEEYPLFSSDPVEAGSRLPAFFASRLTDVDEEFAHAFAEGFYRQDRGFVAQIGAQILDPHAPKFELLDNQRRAFALCVATVKEAFHGSKAATPPKKVVIVEGPPGSGKSVVAARLWASLVTDADLPDGDVVFTTTSASQNSNWESLFEAAGGDLGAGGVVRSANTYMPVTTHRVGRLRAAHGNDFLADAANWRDHLATLRNMGEPFKIGARDDEALVSIVDEAHALINPEHVAGRGQFGFAPSLGPQAYHIIRSSLLTVFFLDPRQGFRLRENTSLEDIKQWSRECGAGEPELISLYGMQFRCAGSAEYVEWVESVLDGAPVGKNQQLAHSWRHEGDGPQMEFRLFDNPELLEEALRERIAEGRSARLLSSFSRAWKTRDAARPHALPPKQQDFNEPYVVAGKKRYWVRPWNFVPRGDYTWFIAAADGSFIAEDSLCEVGCPYAVRGFDFDYVGILWLNDLLWREDRWVIDAKAVEETGFQDLTRRARHEQARGDEGPATRELLERVGQAYRILLTRALKGVYVWVPDEETRGHLDQCLTPMSTR
jgi:DUF2075 family protein